MKKLTLGLVFAFVANAVVADGVEIAVAGIDRPQLGVPLTASVADGAACTFRWIRKGTPDAVVAESAAYEPTVEDLEHWLCVVASRDGGDIGERSFYFSRLPVLYLDTDGGRAIADRETYVPGRLRIQGNAQFARQYDGPVETKGRGYTSWQSFPQKSYKLKLGEKTNLFGYGKQKHWVLITNFADNSFLRNRHGMELAKELGVVAMDMTWVAVVLNGSYYGVEMLAEQNRPDPNRVDIFNWESKAEDVADALFDAAGAAAGWTDADRTALESNMSSNFNWITTGEVAYGGGTYRLADYGLKEDWNLTGGYLYEMEDRPDGPKYRFETAIKKTHVQFAKPEFASTDESMLAAAQKVWNDAEAAYLSVDHYSPDGEKPLSEFADLDSMAGYWLTLECLGNIDCCAGHSRYSHVDVNGKLTFGPVWDFDYGGGSITVQDTEVYGDSQRPDRWVFKFRDEKPPAEGRGGSSFFVDWLDDPFFVAKAYGLYWRKVRPWLAAELAQGGGMDEKVSYLTEAGDAHDAIYKANYEDRCWGFNGEDGDVAKYRAYLTARLEWLDGQFATLDTLMEGVKTTKNAASAHPYEKSAAISFAVAGGIPTNEVCGTDFAVEAVDGRFTLSFATTENAAASADVYLNGVKCARVGLKDGAGEVSVDTAGVGTAASDRHLVSVICRDASGEVVERSYATVLVLGAAKEFSGKYPNGARVTLTEPSTYVLKGADFGSPLVFTGAHPLVLELEEGTWNAAPQVSAEGPVTFVGAGSLTLSGTNGLICAGGDVVVSNGVIGLDFSVVEEKAAAVMMRGNYLQYGGTVTLAMSGDLQGYGFRWKDVKDVEAVIAGGAFTAIVASGEGSAAFKSNKGSNDFTVEGEGRLTANLKSAGTRVVDAAGKVKFKGSARVEVAGEGSKVFSSDETIEIKGGVVNLTADDDCLSAQGGVVISGGTVAVKGGIDGAVTIVGGSVKADAITAQPINGANAAVWCVTTNVEKLNVERLKVEGLAGYGMNDIYPVDGAVYLWLPNGTHEFAIDGVMYRAVVENAATTAVLPEGSKGNPWKIGTEGHEAEVTAWMNGTDTLVIEGVGAVGSMPWAESADGITRLVKAEGVKDVERLVGSLPDLATVNGLTREDFGNAIRGFVAADGFSAIEIENGRAYLDVVVGRSDSLGASAEWTPVSTNTVEVPAPGEQGFFIVVPAAPSNRSGRPDTADVQHD